MHLLAAVLPLISLCIPAFTAPTNASVRPLVIWHGLGDSHSSPGMLEFQRLIKEKHPGVFIHSIYLEEDLDKDRQAGFYGNVNEQIEVAASQILSIPELQLGFDAIGFSQGGQFLRAYQERHAHAAPPIHNLITFGSQHMGVSDLPACRPGDWLCEIARRAARGAVYGSWAQEHLVQAQYFRDPSNLASYLASNHFLTSINNEHAPEDDIPLNTTYASNLRALNKLVLVLFERDKTVVPKESAWFGSEAPPDDDVTQNSEQTVLTQAKTIIPMRLQPLYVQDWIGLRTLDARGDVVLDTCDGEHMQLNDCWERIVRPWIGGTWDE